jgi:hypothetical protein
MDTIRDIHTRPDLLDLAYTKGLEFGTALSAREDLVKK